jgi:hypothetical protein
MITDWRYRVQLIVKNRGLGDALYLHLRAFSGDPEPQDSMFDIELSDGAWACELQAKQVLVDAVEQFNAGEYPPQLASKYTNAEIDFMRQNVMAAYYNIYPDGKTLSLSPTALDDFIASQGYTKV